MSNSQKEHTTSVKVTLGTGVLVSFSDDLALGITVGLMDLAHH